MSIYKTRVFIYLFNSISVFFVLFNSSSVIANTQCAHRDGVWEHRVDTSGDLDIAVTRLNNNQDIWLGGSPGRLQMIKLDGIGNDIKFNPLKDSPGVNVANIRISSDISEETSTLAFYEKSNGGMMTIPMPNLLAVLLRSKILKISIPVLKGVDQVYKVDVSEIPLGAGHRCESEVNNANEVHGKK